MNSESKYVTAYVEPRETSEGTFFDLQLVSSSTGEDLLAANGIPKGSQYPTKSKVKYDLSRKLNMLESNIRVLESENGVVKLWELSGEYKIEELASTNKALKQQGDK